MLLHFLKRLCPFRDQMRNNRHMIVRDIQCFLHMLERLPKNTGITKVLLGDHPLHRTRTAGFENPVHVSGIREVTLGSQSQQTSGADTQRSSTQVSLRNTGPLWERRVSQIDNHWHVRLRNSGVLPMRCNRRRRRGRCKKTVKPRVHGIGVIVW